MPDTRTQPPSAADPWAPVVAGFRDLAVPGRLAVLDYLSRHRGATTDEIVAGLGYHVAVACHHLRVLNRAGFVGISYPGGVTKFQPTDKGYAALVFASWLQPSPSPSPEAYFAANTPEIIP